MMVDFVSGLLEISLGTSIVIMMLFLLSPLLAKNYAAKWKCWIWLIITLRLLLPIDTHFTPGYVSLTLPEINIQNDIQQVSGIRISKTPSESGITAEQTNTLDRESAVTPQNKEASYSKSLTFTEIFVRVWLVGALLYVSYQLLAYYSFRKNVLRWSHPVQNEDIIKQLHEAISQMKIKGTIQVLVSEKVTSPMMIGFLKPILLFPGVRYESTDLHFIIRHELIHYKRHHIWLKLLLLIAHTLHWFNPLVYVMRQRASKDIELCCDEEVVKDYSFDERKAYSNTILASISLTYRQQTVLSTYFNQGRNTLKERIKGVLNMRIKRKGVIAFAVIMICILVASGSFAVNRAIMSQKEITPQLVIDKAPDNREPVEMDNRKNDTNIETGTDKKDGSIDDVTNAVLSNDIDYIKEVIEEGNIDLNTKDSNGQYPLEMTLFMTNCDMAKLLLGAGADPFKVTRDDQTIYDLAMSSDSQYFKDIFEENRVYYFTSTAREALEKYSQALLDSNYTDIHALTYGSKYHEDGQKIWDTIKINQVKVIKEELRENKAYYELELDIIDAGESAFEVGIFPRWLYLIKGEEGWYAEGLMTGGEPEKSWWDN